MVIDPNIMEMVERQALLSPCIRRKYGAAIVSESGIVLANNSRVGRCCEGKMCVRDRFEAPHGQSVEKGAEIHAEQAVLLLRRDFSEATFYLAGYDKYNKALLDKDCRPCHTCAMMMKFAGFNYVAIRNSEGDIQSISISEVIETHEESWGQPF